MKPMSINEKERVKKINEIALYDIGYHHSEQICDEMDALHEQYKDLDFPESLNQWFDKLQKDRSKDKAKAHRIQKIRVYSRRVAIVLAIIMISIGTVTISVEAHRINFFNFIIQTKEKFSIVSIEEDVANDKINFEDLPDNWKIYYYPTYIPSGYILQEATGNESHKRMMFKNSNSNEINFIQMDLTLNVQVDTEDANVMEVEINGYKGLLTEEKGYVIINWYNKDSIFTLEGEVEKNILIRMAESIEKNN